MYFNCAKLNVGDRVAVVTGVPGRIVLTAVEKKTGGGQVTTGSGHRFTKDGHEVGESKTRGAYLLTFEDGEQRLAAEAATKENNAKVSAFVHAVNEATDRRGGDFPKLSDEVKAKLAGMLAEL